MRVGFIVADDAYGIMAQEEAASLGVDLFWRRADTLDYKTYLQDLVQNDKVEAVIVRNPLGYYIQKDSPVPVVLLDISRIDILSSVNKIREPLKIAFLYVPEDKEKYNYDQQDFEKLSPHTFRFFSTQENLRSPKEVLDEEYLQDVGVDVDEFLACDAVVSWSLPLLRYMQTHGGTGICIGVDRFEMRNAIRQAVERIQVRKKMERRSELTHAIINHSPTGYLVVEMDKVVMVSGRICRLCGMTEEEILLQTTHTLGEINDFFKLLFQVQCNEIINYKESAISIHVRDVRLLSEDKNTVQLYTALDVAHIQKTEYGIRKALSSKGTEAKWTFPAIIGESEAMRRTLAMARRYAYTESNVLILGESGTGKEIMAQSIHNASPFARGPFIALNCAAMPETLIESELFGYEEGAFTGARKGGKAGLFELSQNGTLFLDEIGEMPVHLQAKLLRCLQERSVCRVGGSREIPVHNRIICATNRDLKQEVKEKRFREDLLYRIDVLQIRIPPLRERKEDIALFVQTYYKDKLPESEDKTSFMDWMTDCFQRYDWPGNVRELDNMMERILVMSKSGLDPDYMKRYLLDTLKSDEKVPKDALGDAASAQQSPGNEGISIHPGTMREMEAQLLRTFYERCGGNMQELSRQLGMGYTTVWRKLKQFQKGEESVS